MQLGQGWEGTDAAPTARDVIIPDYSAQGSRILRIHSGYSGIGITVNRTTILFIPTILIPEYGQTNAPLTCLGTFTKIIHMNILLLNIIRKVFGFHYKL